MQPRRWVAALAMAVGMSGVVACGIGAHTASCEGVGGARPTTEPISVLAPAAVSDVTPDLPPIAAPYSASNAWHLASASIKQYKADPGTDSLAVVLSTPTGAAVALWQGGGSPEPRWVSDTLVGVPLDRVHLGYFEHGGELWVGLSASLDCDDQSSARAHALMMDVLYAWPVDATPTPGHPVPLRTTIFQHHNDGAALVFTNRGLLRSHVTYDDKSVRTPTFQLFTPDGIEDDREFIGVQRPSMAGVARTTHVTETLDHQAQLIDNATGGVLASYTSPQCVSAPIDFGTGSGVAIEFSPDNRYALVPYTSHRSGVTPGIVLLSADPQNPSRCYDGDFRGQTVDNTGTILAFKSPTATVDPALMIVPRGPVRLLGETTEQLRPSTQLPKLLMAHSALFIDEWTAHAGDRLYWLPRS